MGRGPARPYDTRFDYDTFREVIKSRNITAHSLASICGLPLSYIKNAGYKRMIERDVLEKICKVLGEDPERFIISEVPVKKQEVSITTQEYLERIEELLVDLRGEIDVLQASAEELSQGKMAEVTMLLRIMKMLEGGNNERSEVQSTQA